MSTSHLLLGVNIDHAATLRQARYRAEPETCGRFIEPDPVELALAAERAGADGITVHLREDRRHIQERDVWRLRESIKTRLNLEMACTDAMIAFALKLKPEFACLVPEGRTEVTTEGGLDIVGQRSRVADTVAALSAAGIKTSLFIDPDETSLQAAADMKSPFVELHTGAFAHAYFTSAVVTELDRLRAAADLGQRLGLTVNAGHGINYTNIADIRTIPALHELNIGHSILSRALLTGIDEAVREMKGRMRG